MSDPAIRADGLGKRYCIGRVRDRHPTLRETVSAGMRDIVWALRSRIARDGRWPPADDVLWALKDVSIDIERGEVVGIIGANGAGKSTLLKILSRVTKPTTGYAAIRGRVGSLLEVGTGFHPELTGRDNIYLNGAILGMRRTEIRRKFDEIVEFAEMARFIDTPLKRYSSGMYLRLAFSVAAHLEPDILLVDEVLAVGDAAFQKKCLGKMEEVAQQDRTVLFVSHNMAALSNLCRRACRLDQGRMVDLGDARSVIRRYLLEGRMQEEQDLVQHSRRKAGQRALMRRVRLFENGSPSAVFRTNGPFELEVDCVVRPDELISVSLGFLIRDSLGASVFASTMDQYDSLAPNRTGRIRIRASITKLCLSPGAYSASLYLGNGVYDLDVIENAIGFDVIWEPNSDVPLPPGPGWGPVVVPVCWDWNDGGPPSPD
jgi:lipopolysaccharide transport system ATP-binding protein